MPKSDTTLITIAGCFIQSGSSYLMRFTSVEYHDLVTMYCGRSAALPPELCLCCLEFAGLCGHGNACSFFWVYF